MSELKLLPCPFCGGEAKTSDTTTDEENKFEFGWIGCQECRVFIDYINNQRGKQAAIAAWNRRAQPSEKPENAPDATDINVGSKPLTLEELRGMGGEPIWIKEFPPYAFAGYKVLSLRVVDVYGDIVCEDGDIYDYERYGKTWLAFRSKPKEEV